MCLCVRSYIVEGGGGGGEQSEEPLDNVLKIPHPRSSRQQADISRFRREKKFVRSYIFRNLKTNQCNVFTAK